MFFSSFPFHKSNYKVCLKHFWAAILIFISVWPWNVALFDLKVKSLVSILCCNSSSTNSQCCNSSFSSVISNWNLCPVLCSQCLAADTLAAYGMSEQSRIDERGLREICPTMIQQLDSQACKTQQDQESETSPRPTDAEGKTDYPLRDYG